MTKRKPKLRIVRDWTRLYLTKEEIEAIKPKQEQKP